MMVAVFFMLLAGDRAGAERGNGHFSACLRRF